MRYFLLLLAAALPAFGQMAPQTQATLSVGGAGSVNLDWDGLAARSYFLQYSEDLQHWNYFPVVELGADETLSYGFSSTADRFFVRLRYTDEPTDDPELADFDGDGLNNLEEISVYHTDPFNSDSDGDGLSDGFEVRNGLDPLDNGSTNSNNGPYGDPDADGISNIREQAAGTNPQSADSFPENMVTAMRHAFATRLNYSSGLSGEFTAYCYWTGTPYGVNDSSVLNPTTVNSRLAAQFPFEDAPSDMGSVPHGVLPEEQTAVANAGFNIFPQTGGTAMQGSLLQTRVWMNAPAKSIPQVFTFLKRELFTEGPATNSLGTSIPTSGTRGTPTVETVTIPANETISNSLDLAPVGSQGTNLEKWTYSTLIHVAIVPDDGMAGVVGDMIPSNKLVNPELHFVTPKKTDEIPNEYVVFKATGFQASEIDPTSPTKIVAWSGGEEVVGEPLKRKVKRDASDEPIEIKITMIDGGATVLKLNVWVVWATISAPPSYNLVGPSTFKQVGGSISYEMDSIDNCNFLFKIKPAKLFNDSIDRPALEGANDKPAPGVGKLYKLHPSYNDADTVTKKWDVSRQWQFTIRNPDGILRNVFGPPADFFRNQPANAADPKVASDIAEPFPSDPVEGNDDPLLTSGVDEDADPYSDNANSGFIHHKGEMGSSDTPKYGAQNAWGIDGYRFGTTANFKEFGRLQLWNGTRKEGKFWFRISDYCEWHCTMNVKFDGAAHQWKEDAGSSNGLGLDNQ